MENFLPYVTRKVFTQARRMTSADDKDLGASDREEEKHYLERVREESELPEYDLYADYAEMVVQVPPLRNTHAPQFTSPVCLALMIVRICGALVGDLAYHPCLRSPKQLARTPFRRRKNLHDLPSSCPAESRLDRPLAL